VSTEPGAGHMPQYDQRKAVTSLLLYVVIPKQACDAYLSRCDDAIYSNPYSHEIPQRTQREIGANEIKYSFDFTAHLRTDLSYYEAVSQFIETHDQFICNLLSANGSIPLYLSALLSVDQSLAVFEVKSPRIPESINAFRTFQFDYFVWHPLNGKEAQ
jgi:hypothetical protein